MKKKTFRAAAYTLLLTALCTTTLTLTACGDDDGDTTPITPPTTEVSNLTQNMLTGTWKRIHSRGQETENGRVTDTWDKNVERDNEFFVFYTDGRTVRYDYEDDFRKYVAEAQTTYTLSAGRATFANGTLSNVRIAEYSDNQMVIVYTLRDDDDPNELKQYIDTLRRTSERTDVLDIYDGSTTNPTDLWNPNAPDATNLTKANLQGTWQVTNSKGYTLDNGKVTEPWNKNVERDNDYFVIYPEGNLQLMEFDDDRQAWKIDGQATFSLLDGRATFTSNTLLSLRVLECDGQQMTLQYYTQDAYFSTVQDRYTQTLRRISERTDFLGVK